MGHLKGLKVNETDQRKNSFIYISISTANNMYILLIMELNIFTFYAFSPLLIIQCYMLVVYMVVCGEIETLLGCYVGNVAPCRWSTRGVSRSKETPAVTPSCCLRDCLCLSGILSWISAAELDPGAPLGCSPALSSFTFHLSPFIPREPERFSYRK